MLSRSTSRLIVLTYHRVADVTDDGRYGGLISATPDQFERHLEVLCDRFRLISTSEAVDALMGRRALPRNAVLLTFDDAVDDFEHNVLPALRARSAPAVLFVPTAYVGDDAAVFWWDALHAAVTTTISHDPLATPIGMLPIATQDDRRSTFRRLRDHCKEISREQLDALVIDVCAQLEVTPPRASVMGWDALAAVHAEGLIAVCAHSRTHPHLDLLTPAEAMAEIRGSIDDLERVLGSVPPVFAYPAGRMSDEVKSAAAAAGVAVAFTTKARVERVPSADLLAVGRLNVSSRAGLTGARLRALPGVDRVLSR
jgi:peptidoglycan/xylan/chitin deacetylase (PgdA/CDA1 family)